MGRSAILGEQRNNYFCDVACGKGACGDSTYAITRSGLLCEFNNRRLLDKWVELRVSPLATNQRPKVLTGYGFLPSDNKCQLYSCRRKLYFRGLRRGHHQVFRSGNSQVHHHASEDPLFGRRRQPRNQYYVSKTRTSAIHTGRISGLSINIFHISKKNCSYRVKI